MVPPLTTGGGVGEADCGGVDTGELAPPPHARGRLQWPGLTSSASTLGPQPGLELARPNFYLNEGTSRVE